MFLTRPALYSLRLSLNQTHGSWLFRKNSPMDINTTSALFLATVGLSMSIFSLKQMFSTPMQRRLRRFN